MCNFIIYQSNYMYIINIELKENDFYGFIQVKC